MLSGSSVKYQLTGFFFIEIDSVHVVHQSSPIWRNLYVWVGIFTIKFQLFWGFQIHIPRFFKPGPAELGVHLRKHNFADVHFLYPNRVGADIAIPLLFAPSHCVFKWILCGHLKPTPNAIIINMFEVISIKFW